MHSRQDLHFLHLLLSRPSDKLSTRLDNELDTNLKQSINFNLYMIVLPLSTFFLIITEEVIYFSEFSF